jgi:sorbitol/mannitol transport system permease protein
VLTSIEWQPLSIAVEETLRGQFWAELSVFTSLAIIVPVIVGWLTQKQLVRGLTSGAVK